MTLRAGGGLVMRHVAGKRASAHERPSPGRSVRSAVSIQVLAGSNRCLGEFIGILSALGPEPKGSCQAKRSRRITNHPAECARWLSRTSESAGGSETAHALTRGSHVQRSSWSVELTGLAVVTPATKVASIDLLCGLPAGSTDGESAC